MNKRRLGFDYEEKAARFLQMQGFTVVETNFYCSFGEIDIIAREEEYLCFIEVKFRKSLADGYPQEAVDARKIRRISKSAIAYLNMKKLGTDIPVRFDVVSILGDEITLIRNAFDACF